MRILVLSDSHGNVDNMARAVELTAPDRVLHLGDCQRDLTALRARFPALPRLRAAAINSYSRFNRQKVLLNRFQTFVHFCFNDFRSQNQCDK